MKKVSTLPITAHWQIPDIDHRPNDRYLTLELLFDQVEQAGLWQKIKGEPRTPRAPKEGDACRDGEFTGKLFQAYFEFACKCPKSLSHTFTSDMNYVAFFLHNPDMIIRFNFDAVTSLE